MRSVVLALVVVVALAGCTATTTTAPTASPKPTVTTTTLAPQVLAGFSYADGNKLSASTAKAPVFANTFANADSGWTQGEATDPSNGYWSYTSADGACTSTISQIQIGKNFDHRG